MILQWKPFKISLKSFNDFLLTNVPNADGIVATPDGLLVVEKNSFAQEEVGLVLGYYDGLTQEGEAAKIDLNKQKNLEAHKAALLGLIRDLGLGSSGEG